MALAGILGSIMGKDKALNILRSGYPGRLRKEGRCTGSLVENLVFKKSVILGKICLLYQALHKRLQKPIS